MKVRIAICEDNEAFARKVEKTCKEYFVTVGGACSIELYFSGEEILKGNELSWDILFLDIEMGEVSGIDVKDVLTKRKTETRIVFLTSHQEHMKQAFGRNVMGFIEKRALEKELPVMIRTLYIDILRRTEAWEIDGRRIPLEEIYYIRAEGSYVMVVTEDEELLIRITLTKCAEQLEEKGFMRVQRSSVINLRYVNGVTEHYVELRGSGKIKISRGMCRKIKERYLEFTRTRG